MRSGDLRLCGTGGDIALAAGVSHTLIQPAPTAGDSPGPKKGRPLYKLLRFLHQQVTDLQDQVQASSLAGLLDQVQRLARRA